MDDLAFVHRMHLASSTSPSSPLFSLTASVSSPSASHRALVCTASLFHFTYSSSSSSSTTTFSPSCAPTSVSTFHRCYLLILLTGQSSLL
ncbi:unnamed protein product [Hydatigera taeniaeformis]|uniref:REJ domain-containing protein n=1 Tax=Hydatigena taeniaeformis TaxID=6205 RepID=A0A0R3WWU1_HYDTA|nr:unnamed protein product [Hydatigera taeniaeformis]